MPSAISPHISVQYYLLLVNVRLQYFYLAHPTQTMTMTIKMANTNERRKYLKNLSRDILFDPSIPKMMVAWIPKPIHIVTLIILIVMVGLY